MNFDAPDSNARLHAPARSNTPLQALNLLNDPVFFEAAQALAFRIDARSVRTDFRDRLNYAYRAVPGARAHARREAERLASISIRQLPADPTAEGIRACRSEAAPGWA